MVELRVDLLLGRPEGIPVDGMVGRTGSQLVEAVKLQENAGKKDVEKTLRSKCLTRTYKEQQDILLEL